MRSHAILAGSAALLALAVAAPLAAQDRDDGATLYIFEPEQAAEEEPQQSTPPVPVAQPPVLAPVLPPVIQPATGRAPPKPPRRIHPWEDSALDAVTSVDLVKFSSEGAFARWARRHERIIEDRGDRWLTHAPAAPGDQPIVVAAAFQDAAAVGEQPVCSNPEDCPEDNADVVVSGVRMSSSPQLSVTSPVTTVNGQTITNTQAVGVDEGDIVKQIGDYLLVLQDGRVFATHIGRMQVTDRIDVWRKDENGRNLGADWYDEMLVEGDRVLIMAYSYRDDASELSVFKLDQASGRLAREGVFLISSDDYYSSENYATRIIGDKLILYTPYELEDFAERDNRPFIRRWQGPDEREDDQMRSRAMVGATDIYQPVQRIYEPWVHTVSVCPLGDLAEGKLLDCKTTGFVAPRSAEFYVSPRNIYLWTSASSETELWQMDDCSPQQIKQRPERGDTVPSVLFRLPVSGSDASMLPVNGGLRNQFAMDEHDGRFRALARWENARCEIEDDNPVAHLALYDVSASAFTNTVESYFPAIASGVPSPRTERYENRFADGWLVYGGRTSWRGRPEEEAGAREKDATYPTIAVPVRRPQAAQALALGHNVIRAERLGADMLVNGYGPSLGLSMSMLKLGATAQIGGSVFLANRYESEGRSHAFNARLDADGGGLMGLPTVFDPADGGRAYWRSKPSDLSFVQFSREGLMAQSGEIAGADPEQGTGTHPDYKCEVSCIDWYGNTRPVFLNGRIFGLMGTSLVEARLKDNRIEEVARVDLTAPITRSP